MRIYRPTVCVWICVHIYQRIGFERLTRKPRIKLSYTLHAPSCHNAGGNRPPPPPHPPQPPHGHNPGGNPPPPPETAAAAAALLYDNTLCPSVDEHGKVICDPPGIELEHRKKLEKHPEAT